MTCLWTRLTLLYAATFLQSSDSSYHVRNPGVSLKCNKATKYEETVTVNCTVTYTMQDCGCANFSLLNTNCSVSCSVSKSSWTESRCERDGLTHVLLTISNVEEGNYTVKVDTDCGDARSGPIQLVKGGSRENHGETAPTIIIIAMGILFTGLAVAMCFLFGIVKSKNVLNCDSKEKTQGDLL